MFEVNWMVSRCSSEKDTGFSDNYIPRRARLQVENEEVGFSGIYAEFIIQTLDGE